jgi:hypothetical protein
MIYPIRAAKALLRFLPVASRKQNGIKAGIQKLRSNRLEIRNDIQKYLL